jgi:hypothetical protein
LGSGVPSLGELRGAADRFYSFWVPGTPLGDILDARHTLARAKIATMAESDELSPAEVVFHLRRYARDLEAERRAAQGGRGGNALDSAVERYQAARQGLAPRPDRSPAAPTRRMQPVPPSPPR